METAAMPSAHTPKQNLLLAALSAQEYARLLPDLELMAMPLGLALYESGGHLGYLYFPTSSIVSLLYVMESGASAEIAMTGNEGLVGISLFMGGESTPSRAVVQSAGNGYRLKASVLKMEFARGGEFAHLALRYTQALITQMAQTAVCNRHHTVDQQLCRWLLLSLDRLPSNELMMTQELIANMLGVRREGVTEAAGKLQAAGLIHYHRGKIIVLDRLRLERRVCECYGVVKKEFDRLLPYKFAL
jgi:CRP-like cAMP-binding protein